MSNISAGTTLTTALVNTGDTSGDLQLQVNGTTPSVTLKSNGAVGVGSSPSYGTSGQVLTSSGSSSAPTWTTPSAGAMTLISSATASNSASISFTSLDWATYKNYILIIDQAIPSINGSILFSRTSTNNGSSYDSGSVDYISGGIIYGGGSVNNFGTSGSGQAAMYLTNSVSSVASYGGTSLSLTMFNMASSTYPSIQYNGCQQDTSYGFVAVSGFAQRYNSTTTVNAIQFFFSSGNIVSGTFKLYGIS